MSDERLTLGRAMRQHWPEYLIEGWGLGTFMVSAGVFATLLEFPNSPVRIAIENANLRWVIMGLAMGCTAMAVIYSPWGKQSGAHINPAVTLTFLRLGKIPFADAAFYIAAQFLGGLVGVLLAAALLGRVLADPTVRYVVTTPGSAGELVAFIAELVISFGLMLTVLTAISRPRLTRFTGVMAGVLVATYIAVEAPLSGMSMNPARTTASALPAGVWTAGWMYFVAPPLGMLLAAEAFRALTRGRAKYCAKLDHENNKRCIFCGANQPATGGEG